MRRLGAILTAASLAVAMAVRAQAQTVADYTTYTTGNSYTVSIPPQATIAANQVTVQPGATVVYQATSSIALGLGFSVAPGGNFTASIAQGGVPVITSASNVTGYLGLDFQYTTTATNAPTSYAATAMPAGLSFNTANGIISGTPTAVGTFPVTLTASNGFGTSAAMNLKLAVQSGSPGNGQTVAITPMSYSVNLSANGSRAVTFTASGGQNGYFWTGSNGSGTGNSYTITVSAVGISSVSVFSPAGNGYAQSNTASAVIHVFSDGAWPGDPNNVNELNIHIPTL